MVVKVAVSGAVVVKVAVIRAAVIKVAVIRAAVIKADEEYPMQAISRELAQLGAGA